MPKQLKKGTIVYLPAGEHEITCTLGGKPSRARVSVSAACVPLLQRDLDVMQAAALAGSAPRPCGLFDHKAGAASFLPRRFRWEEGRGVMLDLEWTEAGREAIEGGNYCYHSPLVLMEPEGTHPIGLVTTGVEVGSLVNDPAFRTIEAIAAGRAVTLSASRVSLADLPPTLPIEKTQKPAHNAGMDKLKKLLGLPDDADEAAVLAAVEELKASGNKSQDALSAAQEETKKAQQEAEQNKQKAEETEKELKAARAELDNLKDAGVKAFIAEHEKAGRIAPKDEDAKKAWSEFYRSDALAASRAIMGIPAASDKGVPLAGGRSDTSASDYRSIEELYAEKCH